MSDSAPDRRNVLGNALQAIESLQAKLDAAERARTEPIAIVGLACRFPGAPTAEAYWDLLRDGGDAVTEVPADRWDKAAFLDPDPSVPGKMHAAFGGFLRDVDRFDAAFFGISGREAETMDPQQRLLLEIAWHALEDAGIDASSLRGSQTGVYVGITTTDYGRLALSGARALDVYAATGGALNVAAGRISYTLGLNGPAAAVDSACSSSLVALHLACQSLRNGECSAALAGGVNVLLAPEPFVCFAKWGMMAPDGRCKTFDERADGFVRSEGCGIVVLKRLTDAQAAGDRVHAVVLGSAVNQDGASSGLTVPNGLAQQAVLRAALTGARVAPEDVDYVEAHGTGTTLGDPIELEAIAEVFCKRRRPDQPLYVGSVKTNIGHTESASGIAGLIKIVLSMRHGELPPHLHFGKLNPRILLGRAPLQIPVRRTPWPPTSRPRVAGVSSFGFSGTNAHAILSDAPPSPQSAAIGERSMHLLALSAKSASALTELATAYSGHLSANERGTLADVCHSAAVGRAPLPERLAVVAADEAAAAAALNDFVRGAQVPNVFRGRSAAPHIAFLFTGQGAQYVGMGRALYEAEPVFKAAFDRCARLADRQLKASLSSIVGYEPATISTQYLDQTQYTQPALFAVEYALAELWRSWGVRPTAVMGHSLGEYVAACVAGALSVEDALGLVLARARLMQALPSGGTMIGILAEERRVRAAIPNYAATVSVAAANSPENTVISGRADHVDAVVLQLRRAGIESRPLAVSHAFHSPLIEPMLQEFRALSRDVRSHPSSLGFVSNVTGAFVDDTSILNAAYWCRHAREAVRFADSIRALHERGIRAFVEIGPSSVLLGMARQCVDDADTLWLPSLRKDHDPYAPMLSSLGSLFVRGVQPDWHALGRATGRPRVDLPRYPFQRHRFWLPPAEPQTVARAAETPDIEAHPLLGRRLESPRRDIEFEAPLSAIACPVLSEHKVAGLVIVPAAAFIELGRAAGTNVFESPSVRIEQGWLRAPLIIDQTSNRDVRLVVSPADKARASFEVFSRSRNESKGTWTSHAGGEIVIGRAVEPELTDAALRKRCVDAIDIEAYRQRMAAVGLDYGPSFRALITAWRGRDEAVGDLRLPAHDESAHRFGAHPGMLDAAFHLIGVALGDDAGDRFYLPVGYEAAEVYAPLGSEAWAHVRLRAREPSSVTADISLWRTDGTKLGYVRGLQVRPVSSEQFRRVLGSARTGLLRPAWRSTTAGQTAETPGDWQIVGGGGELASAIAASMTARRQRVRIVDANDVRLPIGATREQAGILDLRAIDLPDLDPVAPDRMPSEAVRDSAVERAVALFSEIARAQLTGTLRLLVVTRNAHAVAPEDSVNPLGATLWSVAVTAAAELPGVDVRLLDLDGVSLADASAVAEAIASVALRQDSESRLALRSSDLFAARLVAAEGSGTNDSSAPYKLIIQERGTLSGLRIESRSRTAPGNGEVEIEVLASGLNFRDVLNLLDMYPGQAGELGNECCGRVIAVGPGVTEPVVGALVACIAEATFGSHVIAKTALTFPVPSTLSIAQAAVFPIAQLTAYMALHRVGRIRRGHRVLIHAAAGGVGLAAVHLAIAAGAEVLATAGSAEKRDYLRSLGVRHVFDSRRVLAASVVRESTDGHGVDLLLNSLTGEFIDQGLMALAPGGEFLEIGLRELRSIEAVKRQRDDVNYHALLLGDLCRDEPAAVRAMYDRLLALLETRDIPAPLVRNYPMAQVESAFRFMAKARHVGRIAVVHRGGHARADASYLVTGGLGGLGLQMANWLVEHGARHVVLMGRSAPSEGAAQRVAELRSKGVRVEVVRGDVASPETLELLAGFNPPLRGIIHAAGVVDDAILARLEMERVARVMRPKADGACNLLRTVADTDLDFFVLFSSGSAILGSPGQAAYAGANGFLDAVAHRLRARGRNAVSVNWGAWASAGMATQVDARVTRDWAARGVGMLTLDNAFRALDEALDSGLPQVAVLPIDWPKFCASLGSAGAPPLIEELVPQGAVPSAVEAARPVVSLRDILRNLPSKQQLELIAEKIRIETAAVLGVNVAQIEFRAGLTEQGMDSLMAVELANRLGRVLGVPLSSTFAFEHPTLSALTRHLHKQLAPPPSDVGNAQAVTPKASPENDVSDLAESDLETELRRELDEAGF